MLPWRVRTTKDSPGLEYLLPFDYANFTYVSSSDGNPCLPSGLLSYGWHQPTYAKDSLGRLTDTLEWVEWTEQSFKARGLDTPLSGQRFKCMISRKWLDQDPGACGISYEQPRCGNISGQVEPSLWSASHRGDYMVEECAHYNQFPDCGIIPHESAYWDKVKPASAMSGWHRHVRSIDSILYSAVAMYVLGGVSLMCAYLVHRYWVEREVGFEHTLVSGPRARHANVVPKLQEAKHEEVFDIKEGYLSYLDGWEESVQIVNLTSMDVDVRMIDNDVGDADDDEREVSCGVVGAGGTIDAKLAQGVWIRARTVDGTRATLFLTEAFAYTSTYARILGRDRLPLPCEPRTAWMCPLVHYDTYRVIVSIHQLQPGQSLTPANVDTVGQIHAMRKDKRVRALIAKARAVGGMALAGKAAKDYRHKVEAAKVTATKAPSSKAPRTVSLSTTAATHGPPLTDHRDRPRPSRKPRGASESSKGQWALSPALTWVWVEPGMPGYDRVTALDSRGRPAPDSRPADAALMGAGDGQGFDALGNWARVEGEWAWVGREDPRWSSLFPPMPAAMEATDTDFDEEGDAGAEEGAVMDEDVAVGNVPHKAGSWVMRAGDWVWKEVGEEWPDAQEPRHAVYTQSDMRRPEVLDVSPVASPDAEPGRPVSLLVANAEGVVVRLSAVTPDGSIAELQTLKPKRRWRGEVPAGTWLVADNLSDDHDPLFFEETLVPVAAGLRGRKDHPWGVSRRTSWMVPFDTHRGYDIRLEMRLVSAIDGRLLPLSLPHAPLHAGPEVAHFSNVNSSAQGEGTATVLIRNAQRFEVAVQVYDAEGRPHTHATLRAGERVSATLPRGAWIRAVEASDPQASLKRLFWDESLHYVGPGIPSQRPKGASPRVHWMVPYEERGLHETRLVVRNAASAKATVVEVDLAATQDHALLQRMMGKG